MENILVEYWYVIANKHTVRSTGSHTIIEKLLKTELNSNNLIVRFEFPYLNYSFAQSSVADAFYILEIVTNGQDYVIV